MFMVKGELENIKKLLNIRLKSQAYGFFWQSIAVAVMTIGSLLSPIFGILKNNDDFRGYHFTDFSVWFIIGIIIGITVLIFMYRQTNTTLSAFPQTNNSRFISSVLVNYIIAVFSSLLVLVMYLIDLGVITLLSVFKDNIRFALNIDIGFIVAGLFVCLAYMFLIIAVIELAGTILRKWTHYAVIAFIALVSITIINLSLVGNYALGAFAFLMEEPSLALFFIKAICLWIIVTGLALVINRFTIYGKSPNNPFTKGAVVICAVVASVISFIVPFVTIFNDATSTNSFTSVEAISYQEQADNRVIDITRIDISHLPKGSKINIGGSNIVLPGYTSYNYNRDAVAVGVDALTDIQGDMLIIKFSPANFIVNGIEILQYTNQRVMAHLDGDTLTIDYARDNASVVFLPIWGIVRQFDCFKDKGVLASNLVGFSSGWRGSTNIYISVE
jgi:MFS family permease